VLSKPCGRWKHMEETTMRTNLEESLINEASWPISDSSSSSSEWELSLLGSTTEDGKSADAGGPIGPPEEVPYPPDKP